MGNNLSSSCTAVPSAAACRTDHVVALLGGALAASIYHVSCGSIMLWNSAQKHWSPPPHGKMQAVRRWIRSALHPAEHALEASSWSSHGVRFRGMEERISQRISKLSKNRLDKKLRKITAQLFDGAHFAISCCASQDLSLRFETSRSDRLGANVQ